MLDFEYIRASLDGVAARYDAYLDALKWSVGPMTDIPRELLPRPEGDAGEQALNRLARMAVSAGPTLLQQIRDGVIGDVNWGGDSNQLDKRLEELDLDVLAEKLLERGLVGGFMCGIVAQVSPGQYVIRRLGGYVEPITDEFDYDTVRGIAQVMRERPRNGQSRYTVRAYDLETSTLREWRDVTSPDQMRNDVEPMALEFVPRFVVLQVGADGLPVGDMQRALPLIKAEWASQVRGDRVEEATGFPQAVVKGDVLSGVDKRGPTNIIEISADGDYKFVLPGDLSQIHEHHDRKVERLYSTLRLPAGSLGGQTPSGEALREAAVKFVQMCSRYASSLSTLMTDLTADLAMAHGLEPVPVTVSIDREVARELEINTVLSLWNAELISFGAAVRAISVHVPTWPAAEVEAFIRSKTEWSEATAVRDAVANREPEAPGDNATISDMGSAPADPVEA